MKKHSAFTLIELLIVIIIIGILAGMLMLATGSATDKAEATKIVNNMVVVKKALLLYYTDNGEWPENIGNGSGTTGANDTPANSILKGYLDRDLPPEYTIIQNKQNSGKGSNYKGSIFVKYNAANKLSDGVRKQLEIMAPNANLWNTSSWTDDKYNNGKYSTYYYHYYYINGNSKTGLNSIHLPVYLVKN